MLSEVVFDSKHSHFCFMSTDDRERGAPLPPTSVHLTISQALLCCFFLSGNIFRHFIGVIKWNFKHSPSRCFFFLRYTHWKTQRHRDIETVAMPWFLLKPLSSWAYMKLNKKKRQQWILRCVYIETLRERCQRPETAHGDESHAMMGRERRNQ